MRDRTQASTGHGESVRTINGGAECLSSTHVSLQQHRESESCLLAGHTRNASVPKNGYTENCDDSAVIIVPFYVPAQEPQERFHRPTQSSAHRLIGTNVKAK